MKEKTFSILQTAITVVFAAVLIALFSLIIIVPMPDAVLTALGWTAIISGVFTLILSIIRIRG